MGEFLDQIRTNAQSGEGACAGCSAHRSGGCSFVNPGLLNPQGEVMFVTDEPSHAPKWEKHDSWESYNGYWGERFKELRGGRFLSRLLAPTTLTLDDVWLADSIKCPTVAHSKRGIPSADTEDAFAHCRHYLRDEIEFVDPAAIVTLGSDATKRTLQALGVSTSKAKRVRVTKAYGTSDFDTDYPLVISLHWAQRTVKQSEWVPVVQESLQSILEQ